MTTTPKPRKKYSTNRRKTVSRDRQAMVVQHALERLGMNANQFRIAMGWKSTATVYRIMSGEEAITYPPTIEKAAAILKISPDDLYAADKRIPPDVEDAITAHPHQMYKLIRLARQRMED